MIKNLFVRSMEGVVGNYKVRLHNPGDDTTEEWAVIRWPADQEFHSATCESYTIKGWETTMTSHTQTRYLTLAELDKLLS
jgi:hypothetical protein